MKHFTLEDLPKIALSVTERLALFREEDHYEDGLKIEPFWPDGWESAESMWDYRWEKQFATDHCTSLLFIAKPVKMIRLIKSIEPDKFSGGMKGPFFDITELTKLIEDYSNKVIFKLQDHTSMGHHEHTTLDIYEERYETEDEFQVRKRAQEAFINKVLQEQEEKKQRDRKRKEEKELQELEKLKNKYEKEGV